MTNTLIDPSSQDDAASKAGVLLKPLFTWRGRNVYPIFGAEDPEGGSGDPDSEPGGGGDPEGTGAGEPKDTEKPVTREDFERLQKQLSAADKKREEAEKALKKIDDAKKDELTKATERAEELEKTVQERDKQIADLRLQNAFLTADTGVTWHDPGDALALAERKGYLADVVGQDGQVDASALGKKLKEFASKHKHMVKSDGGDNGGSDEGKEQRTGPTGGKVGGKGKGGSKDEPDLSRYQNRLNR
jgi:hypothetical protein